MNDANFMPDRGENSEKSMGNSRVDDDVTPPGGDTILRKITA
jgi:hypothetical protein